MRFLTSVFVAAGILAAAEDAERRQPGTVLSLIVSEKLMEEILMTIQKLPRSVQKMFHIVALALAASVGLPAAAQDASGPILFTNVNVFDGVNEALIENANVVVTGNMITAVSTEPLGRRRRQGDRRRRTDVDARDDRCALAHRPLEYFSGRVHER